MGGCQVSLEKQANGQRRIDVYLQFKESLNNVLITSSRTSISKNSALKFQNAAVFA